MATAQSSKINLLNFDQKQLGNYFKSIGQQSFRASQVMKWIYHFGIEDFAQMSNLSKSLREYLLEHCEIKVPKVAIDRLSSDGTRKFLLRLDCDNCIETVFIPEGERGTLCISSQIGCALNCTFCSTAQQGFNRNLTVGEIVGQVYLADKLLRADQENKEHRPITNVVLMGMGEPLLNFDNVVPAMNVMLDDFGFGISKYRLTLSTSGVVPNINKLAEVSDVALAISLHATNDELRTEIVPINKKYPIKMLIEACENYFKDQPRRHVTIEYVMLKDVNDQPKHAKQLVKILQNLKSKVNLIPFNPFPNTLYECSDWETIKQFQSTLKAAGIQTMVRKTRGQDIDAACGQLAGEFFDRTKRSQKLQAIPITRE